MKKVKIHTLISVLFLSSIILAGCSLFPKKEEPTPTPEPPIEKEQPTPTIALPTEQATPSPEITEVPEIDPDITPSITSQPEQDSPEFGKIRIKSAEITELTSQEMKINVQGETLDTCTNYRYTWELSTDNTVKITLGEDTQDEADCKESIKSYETNITINYSFKEGKEYKANINGYETNIIGFTL